jgi:Na+-translocating ferredoxin:NAD+ oxidoreductase RNF subunit RnfB
LDQARAIVDEKERFWISNCGCREEGAGCARSRIDLCLQFRDDIPGGGGSGLHEVSRSDVDEVLKEAQERRLVARPYRNEQNRRETDGICFCCDDCCWYFVREEEEEECDKGSLIETTERDACRDCASCVGGCYFNARKIENGRLVLDRDECYGCGLCVDLCPEECIQMVQRR